MRDIFASAFEHDDPNLNNGDPIEKTMSLPEFLEGLLKAGVRKHGKNMKNLYILSINSSIDVKYVKKLVWN